MTSKKNNTRKPDRDSVTKDMMPYKGYDEKSDIDKTFKYGILGKQNYNFRNEIKTFIINLIKCVYGVCFALLVGDIIYLLLNEGEHLYSEWFLISLFGSQLVILPLLLMRIIASHLFPQDK